MHISKMRGSWIFFCAAVAATGTYTNPILSGDFPDPGAIYVNGTFFVATTGDGFPIHTSANLRHWSSAGSVFARDNTPTWASGDFWAPEIHAMPIGGFVVYFTARDHDSRLCIGAATSASPAGPFQDIGQPLARDPEGKGMYLDSHYFFDTTGSGVGYLIWKRGTVTPPAETHTLLYLQQLDAAGTSLVGPRSVILKNDLSSWEKGVVEAPWVVRPAGSSYFYLFYSAAHCCDGSGSYAVGVARAASITGPYEKHALNPILHSNSISSNFSNSGRGSSSADRAAAKAGGFDGTGHCSVLPDPVNPHTWIIFYHAYVRPKTGGARSLLMDVLTFDTAGAADTSGGAGVGWPRLSTNTSSPSVGPRPLPPTADRNGTST